MRNKAQLVTKAICNKGFGGNSSVLTRSNFGVVGQESSPQSLTAATLDRYKQSSLYQKPLTNQANELLTKLLSLYYSMQGRFTNCCF
jgi:hypothetical protein